MANSERPRKPGRVAGRGPALLLAIAVHALFIGVLIFSIRWQNRPVPAITAELYAPTTQAPAPQPAPPPEPPKAEVSPSPPPPPPPAAKAEPQPPPPPKAAPKPEPKVEPPDTQAAEIARKVRLEAERQAKLEAERKAKEAAQRERLEREQREAAQKKLQEEQRQLAEARDRQARMAQEMKLQAERERAQREAQQQAIAANEAALSRAEADYIRRIQAKIRGNVTLPPDLPGNPEAIFEVVQLPTGEIIEARLKKSSGFRAYDEAVQRAIQKSSPLPRPDRPELFQRALQLKFRPLD
jgi:colicin import membrane protein